MSRPTDQKRTPDIAREICQRTRSTAVLDVSITSLGNQYVLGIKVVNCRSGDLLAEEQVTAEGKERILRALGEAATKLRTKLGESLNTVEQFDTPLEQATTPSLEAFQTYNLGRQSIYRGERETQVPLFQRAIALDPNFVMAYASLEMVYNSLYKEALAAENLQKAYNLREHVGEREKFYIESHYYEFVLGDLDKARQVYELPARLSAGPIPAS